MSFRWGQVGIKMLKWQKLEMKGDRRPRKLERLELTMVKTLLALLVLKTKPTYQPQISTENTESTKIRSLKRDLNLKFKTEKR
jgi:hypothetical protein